MLMTFMSDNIVGKGHSLNFNFVKWLVKVVTFMCAHGPAPDVARGRKHCHGQCMASLYKHGETSKGGNFNSKA